MANINQWQPGAPEFLIFQGNECCLSDVDLPSCHVLVYRLSKAKKDSVVWAYFRIDENITIIVAPYRYCDEGKADTKVEL